MVERYRACTKSLRVERPFYVNYSVLYTFSHSISAYGTENPFHHQTLSLTT